VKPAESIGMVILRRVAMGDNGLFKSSLTRRTGGCLAFPWFHPRLQSSHRDAMKEHVQLECYARTYVRAWATCQSRHIGLSRYVVSEGPKLDKVT